MNSWNRDIYIKAWDFASIHHSGQTYGGPLEGQQIDYINHIGAVVAELMWMLQHHNEALDADLLLQCALLHDTIEDTTVTYEDICSNFGANIGKGVAALTKNEKLPTKEEQMADSLKRIKEQPLEIWMVKMADRITNLSQPPYYWTAAKIQKYHKEAQTIYEELGSCNIILKKRFENRLNNYLNFQNNSIL